MAPLGLEPWNSRLMEEGSMACSLSAPLSMSCSSSAWGKPNMKRADRKSKAPHRRKPPHHAPIQRGSSGVMSSLPWLEGKKIHSSHRGKDEYWCTSRGHNKITSVSVWYNFAIFLTIYFPTYWYQWKQHQHKLWYRQILRWSHKLGRTLKLKIGYLQDNQRYRTTSLSENDSMQQNPKKQKTPTHFSVCTIKWPKPRGHMHFTSLFSRGQPCIKLFITSTFYSIRYDASYYKVYLLIALCD